MYVLVFYLFLCFAFCSDVSHDETNRPSVSESNAAEAKEAAHVLHPPADRRAGEAVSQAEVPRVRRACRTGEIAQDDRRAGEDVVSKSADKMEVRFHIT